VDTGSMAIGVTDWDTVEKRIYYTPKSPCAKVKFLPGDYTILAKDIVPSNKTITSEEILENLQTILWIMNRISDLAEENEVTCDYIIEEFLVDDDVAIPTLYVSVKDSVLIIYDAITDEDELYAVN